MLKYATIGTSWITEQMIEAARMTQRYQLRAIYSRNLDTAKNFAKAQSADYYTTELNNILFDPDIDLVYIASPNSLHFEQALKLVEAGKHIIVEKPIFTSSAQWHQVYDLADEKGVYVFEAALHFHSRNYARLRPIIQQKMLESTFPLVGANFNCNRYSSRYETYLEAKENHWPLPNVFTAKYQGGALMDLGVYPLYIALDLFGMPTAVRYHAVDNGDKLDLQGTILLKYPQAQVSINVSKVSHSTMSSEIYLGNETLIIEDIDRITKASLVNHQGESVQLINYRPANPMYDELLSFVEMIENKDTIHKEVRYEAWRQLSLQVVQVMELLRQSAQLFE